MTYDSETRDILHETADAIALLGSEYEATGVDCDPGDTAVKITKQESGRTLYIISFSDTGDTEIRVYDEDDHLIMQHFYYNVTFGGFLPDDIADDIRKSF